MVRFPRLAESASTGALEFNLRHIDILSIIVMMNSPDIVERGLPLMDRRKLVAECVRVHLM